jgi:hypothetical protein
MLQPSTTRCSSEIADRFVATEQKMHEVADVDVGTAVALGIAGGGIAEVVHRWMDLTAWQKARHTARRRGQALPALAKYFDPLADCLVALTRLAMGAGAGWLFHTEVSGISAAIAVGVAAPALLAQVGSGRDTR